MSSDAEKISALFRDFEVSAFRLEVQQTYRIPAEQERLANFLAGQAKPVRDTSWHQNVAAKVASGKDMRRAKIVRRPLTDYTRFLIAWGIPDNVRAGERYRIVDLTDRQLDLPEHDFWFFDDKSVVVLDFAPDGTLRNRELFDKPDLGQYRYWRDLAWSNGISFDEWDAGT